MATFYIDPAGDDANDGSEGSPWATLRHAIDNSAIDDTIVAEDGVYLETSDAAGFGARILTSKSLSPNSCVFDFQNVNFTGVSASDLCRITGVTFKNTKSSAGNKQPFTGFGATVEKCIFRNCTGEDGGFFGAVFRIGDGLSFSECVFIDCYINGALGNVALIGSNNDSGEATLDRCVVFYSDAVPPAGLSIPNNVFMTNGNPSVAFGAKNVIFYSGDAGAFGGYNAGSAVVSADSCCFFNVPMPSSGSGLIASDPLFVDPSNGDLRLRPGSPCIGTGSL